MKPDMALSSPAKRLKTTVTGQNTISRAQQLYGPRPLRRLNQRSRRKARRLIETVDRNRNCRIASRRDDCEDFGQRIARIQSLKRPIRVGRRIGPDTVCINRERTTIESSDGLRRPLASVRAKQVVHIPSRGQQSTA